MPDEDGQGDQTESGIQEEILRKENSLDAAKCVSRQREVKS